jgi:hypothetical protein
MAGSGAEKGLKRAGLAGAVVLALGVAVPAHAARFGVPTNLDAAGQVTAASADPPGWFVLERIDSGSQNGDVVKQIRLFVEVTGPTLDVRVFDAGLSGARDLGRPVQFRYRLRDPADNTIATATVTTDTAATEDRLARFACQDGSATAVFRTPDTPLGATNRIFGAGPGRAPLAATARVSRSRPELDGPDVRGHHAFGGLWRAGTPTRHDRPRRPTPSTRRHRRPR